MYCSQHHDNPAGSRFCRICGEALATPDYPRLGSRYQIVAELGQGGFGRTYLAKDLNRFQEQCVLKEFLPQVNSAASLRKAEELFQREAGVLYQLDHPQIPKFRELLRVGEGDQAKLFLVQDYVAGATYRSQLRQYQQHYQRNFTEAEVLDLLRQILPVIHYIHSVGVIHRDIAPDNLIQRATDQCPVLIDFGGVKQVAEQVQQQLHVPAESPEGATRLGKVGYAPHEQMQSGLVSPSSDLYALAVTAVVLLTGEEPSRLFDAHTLTWNWRSRVVVSDRLGNVLDRALAYRPSDRLGSAQDMIAALGFPPLAAPVAPATPAPAVPPPPAPAAPPATAATVAVSPGVPRRPAAAPRSPHRSAPAPRPAPQPAPPRRSATTPPPQSNSAWIGTLLLALVTLGSLGGVWWLITEWEPASPRQDQGQVDLPPADQPDDDGTLPQSEQDRRRALNRRRDRLGLDPEFLTSLVNDAFYAANPDASQLTDSPADADLRLAWIEIGEQFLEVMDQELSRSARQQLGEYDEGDRLAWREQHEFSWPAHNDLTDAEFFQAFPAQAGQDFIDQPIGQIWQALAFDILSELQQGESSPLVTRVRFDPGAYREQVSGQLAPGAGQIYLIGMQAGQQFRFTLEAPAAAFQISVYRHGQAYTNALLEDSQQSTWSTILPEDGFYEVVLVSRADESFDYTLDLVAENVSGS